MAARVLKDRRPRRRPPFREPRSRILVLCCGQVTEPQYFKALVGRVRNPSVVVKVKVGEKSDPAALVREARAVKSRDEFDEIRCVADVDEFDVLAAAQGARGDDSLSLAISNPCFELWLLLHFAEWHKYASTCHQLVHELRKHVPGYDKHVLFAKYQAGVNDAMARAMDLDSSENSYPNPSTGVWRLVEAIKGGATSTAI